MTDKAHPWPLCSTHKRHEHIYIESCCSHPHTATTWDRWFQINVCDGCVADVFRQAMDRVSNP